MTALLIILCVLSLIYEVSFFKPPAMVPKEVANTWTLGQLITKLSVLILFMLCDTAYWVFMVFLVGQEDVMLTRLGQVLLLLTFLHINYQSIYDENKFIAQTDRWVSIGILTYVLYNLMLL